jgi:hypothetical protein
LEWKAEIGGLEMEVYHGSDKKMFGLKFVWWGLPQWYKWRWHTTHIDMGVLSVYDLPARGFWKYFWKLIAVLIKPMRIIYRTFFMDQQYRDMRKNKDQ